MVDCMAPQIGRPEETAQASTSALTTTGSSFLTSAKAVAKLQAVSGMGPIAIAQLRTNASSDFIKASYGASFLITYKIESATPTNTPTRMRGIQPAAIMLYLTQPPIPCPYQN